MDENDDNEINDLLDPDIVALLRDSSLWLEPSAQLEDRVAAGIAEERRVVVPIGRARRAWPGRLAAAAIGAAAAAAVVLIAVPATTRINRPTPRSTSSAPTSHPASAATQASPNSTRACASTSR